LQFLSPITFSSLSVFVAPELFAVKGPAKSADQEHAPKPLAFTEAENSPQRLFACVDSVAARAANTSGVLQPYDTGMHQHFWEIK
jgi:hypothetical protein